MMGMSLTSIGDGSVLEWLADSLFYHSTSGHRVGTRASTHFYTATKFAVTAVTEGVRQELREMKSNCRVTVGHTSCDAIIVL